MAYSSNEGGWKQHLSELAEIGHFRPYSEMEEQFAMTTCYYDISWFFRALRVVNVLHLWIMDTSRNLPSRKIKCLQNFSKCSTTSSNMLWINPGVFLKVEEHLLKLRTNLLLRKGRHRRVSTIHGQPPIFTHCLRFASLVHYKGWVLTP